LPWRSADGHDKTYLALPRLLHVLALVYMVSALPVVRRIASARAVGWLRLLGRQGLLVFSLGTVLAIAGQVLLAGVPGDARLVHAIPPTGLALLIGAAWLAERLATGPRRHPPSTARDVQVAVAVSDAAKWRVAVSRVAVSAPISATRSASA